MCVFTFGSCSFRSVWFPPSTNYNSTMSPPVNTDLGYIPPDGGWGWAIVFGASISTGFAYSFPKAFTIFYKELQDIYNISYGQIAWISSIMCATTYGGGE